jgi:tRNA(fMet)-specific endonuclease VapC
MEIKSAVIDVNSYTAFKLGTPSAIEMIDHIPILIINSVIMGELLSGFAFGSKEEKNKEELELFLKSERVRFAVIDRNTSGYYSTIYKELRLKGKPIPTNDLWIAATAIQFGAALFTYDKHFEFIPGLQVISKLDDLK